MVHLNLTGLWRGQDGTVSVMAYCGVQTPVDAKDIICSLSRLAQGPTYPLCNGSLGGGGLFPGRDVAECVIDRPPLSSAKVRNEW
jgi:hypothetical protein